MAKDMMGQMLEGVVDHILSKTGITKESLGQTINEVITGVKDARERIERIETMLQKLTGDTDGTGRSNSDRGAGDGGTTGFIASGNLGPRRGGIGGGNGDSPS